MKRTIYQALKVGVALGVLTLWITALKSLGAGRTTTLQWNDDHQSFKFVVHGEVHFTDDEADVKSVSPEGSLLIEQKNAYGRHRFEARPEADGGVRRSYTVNGENRPWIPDGKSWLARQLPDLVRDSAIDAAERIARRRRNKGESGVLDYIALAHGDGAKRIYFQELFAGDPPALETKRRAIHQIALEIHSDGDKAALLKTLARHFVHDDALRDGFFEAGRTIRSSGDRRSLLDEVLQQSGDEAATVKRVADAAAGMSSDGDKSAVLIHAIEHSGRDESLQTACLDAVNTIHSDGDHQRVLAALLQYGIASDEVFLRALASAARMGSDGDKAHFLTAAASKFPDGHPVFEGFLDTTKTIHSDGDKAHVLSAWLEHNNHPHDACEKIRSFAQTEIHSEGDRRQVERLAEQRQDEFR